MVHKLKRIMDYEHAAFNDKHTCDTTSDCPEGFFCKNYDCIAKRSEGSFCLSGSDDECNCGKCVIDKSTWTHVCMSGDLGQCKNRGITPENSCEHERHCLKGYFCDLNNSVCTSKLPAGRVCHNHRDCQCNKCIDKSYKTRPGMPAIEFRVCGDC